MFTGKLIKMRSAVAAPSFNKFLEEFVAIGLTFMNQNFDR